MAFTASQDQAIQITERVGSAVSLLCSCTVIATFFSTEHFRSPVHRLIFFATWGNVWSNIGMLIALSGISRGETSALCQFQGFLIQWFPPADAYWSLCMALNVFMTCFRRYDIAMLRKLEWKYIIFSYGTSFLPALIFLFIETKSKGKIYGSAFIWCWVTVHWRALYLAVYYVPVWIANILTIWIYLWTGREIIQSRRQLQRLVRGVHIPERHPSGTSISFTHRLMSTQNSESDSGRQNIDLPGQRNSVVWPYAKHAILFFTSILITWAPCTVNRLYSYANPDKPSFVLNYLQSLFLPLQGFWNSCIYMSTISSPLKRFLDWKKSLRSHSV